MASFWDKVKRFFGAGGSDAQGRIRDAMLRLAGAKRSFTAKDIADEVIGPAASDVELGGVGVFVDVLFQQGVLNAAGYRRVEQQPGVFLYNPYSGDPPGSGSKPAPVF